MESIESQSAKDSLQFIESMIHKAQNRYSENGTLYLLWGWTIFLCSLVQYLSLKFTSFSNASLIWLLVVFVMIYQIFYLSKKRQTDKVTT